MKKNSSNYCNTNYIAFGCWLLTNMLYREKVFIFFLLHISKLLDIMKLQLMLAIKHNTKNAF